MEREHLSVAVRFEVSRYFASKQPINDSEVEEREENAENPPCEPNSDRMGSC
jgi:hypothetical protein